jgi:hypothetical protein
MVGYQVIFAIYFRQGQGFPIIADWGFLISEIKLSTFIFTKYKRLLFRNPTFDISSVRRISIIADLEFLISEIKLSTFFYKI